MNKEASMYRCVSSLCIVFATLGFAPWTLAAEDAFQGMSPATPALTQSRTPIPALTDADRAAVYNAPGGHQVHDSGVNAMLLINQLEWQGGDGNAQSWDIKGWVGGDIDRLWLRSEGERSAGRTESAEAQALWGRAISPWWDLVGGVRQDFKPGASQTWAAFGLQGMALYNFEAEATLFVGESGHTAARLEGEIGRAHV